MGKYHIRYDVTLLRAEESGFEPLSYTFVHSRDLDEWAGGTFTTAGVMREADRLVAAVREQLRQATEGLLVTLSFQQPEIPFPE